MTISGFCSTEGVKMVHVVAVIKVLEELVLLTLVTVEDEVETDWANILAFCRRKNMKWKVFEVNVKFSEWLKWAVLWSLQNILNWKLNLKKYEDL